MTSAGLSTTGYAEPPPGSFVCFPATSLVLTTFGSLFDIPSGNVNINLLKDYQHNYYEKT
jgi:hypothetical protein